MQIFESVYKALGWAGTLVLIATLLGLLLLSIRSAASSPKRAHLLLWIAIAVAAIAFGYAASRNIAEVRRLDRDRREQISTAAATEASAPAAALILA